MRTGIIGAMEEEVKSLVINMQDVVETHRAGTVVYNGKLCGQDVCVVKCGVGKVAAAAVTQLLISEFGIDCAINTGLAGGLKKGIKVGDVVISTQTEYFDVTPSVLRANFPNGGVYQADKKLVEKAVRAAKELGIEDKLHVDVVTTGDQFITESAQKQWLLGITSARCNDMEGAAIAQTCYNNGKPFLIVRIISDLADDSAKDTYYDFKKEAPKLCNDVIMNMLSMI